MKDNLIKKLYCMSFLLKEKPSVKIFKITETFQQAMNFKKVLVYKQTPTGFQNVASSPPPGMCCSALNGMKNLLQFDIEDHAGTKLGKLCVIPKRNGWLSKDKKDIVRAFAVQLGLLLDEMSKPESNQTGCFEKEVYRYKFMLNRDWLTGLYNRHYFEESLNSLERQGVYPVSIIMVDVDGLKIINDTFGHRCGDGVLKAAAELLKNTFRKEDIVARIGGDEFAVLLPGTPENIAVQKCRLLSQNLKSYKKTDKTAKLHFSCGSATSEAPGEPLRDVMERADSKMYAQKRKYYLKNSHLCASYPYQVFTNI